MNQINSTKKSQK